jgi:hypothetical protein
MRFEMGVLTTYVSMALTDTLNIIGPWTARRGFVCDMQREPVLLANELRV